MNNNEKVKWAAEKFLGAIPHCQILGMTVTDVSEEGVIVNMPFQSELEANPGSGIIHSGAITTLMDSTCGITACIALPGFEISPTLDLRLDYLGLPDPFKPVKCFAEAYRVTQTIVFTRGIAYQEDREHPFAHGVGTFMRTGKKLVDLAEELR